LSKRLEEDYALVLPGNRCTVMGITRPHKGTHNARIIFIAKEVSRPGVVLWATFSNRSTHSSYKAKYRFSLPLEPKSTKKSG
jgi:hypothetical protein